MQLTIEEVKLRGDKNSDYLHYSQLSQSQQQMVAQFHPSLDELSYTKYWYPVTISGAVKIGTLRVFDWKIRK